MILRRDRCLHFEVDAFVDPEGGAVVELGDTGRRGQPQLFEHPVLHVSERPFHLPLSLGIRCLTGPDVTTMERGEVDRRRVQLEAESKLADGSRGVGSNGDAISGPRDRSRWWRPDGLQRPASALRP